VRDPLDGDRAVASRLADGGAIVLEDARQLEEANGLARHRGLTQASRLVVKGRWLTSLMSLGASVLLGTKATAHSANTPAPATSPMIAIAEERLEAAAVPSISCDRLYSERWVGAPEHRRL